jgi:small-conductance mechanosensitive channel
MGRVTQACLLAGWIAALAAGTAAAQAPSTIQQPALMPAAQAQAQSQQAQAQAPTSAPAGAPAASQPAPAEAVPPPRPQPQPIVIPEDITQPVARLTAELASAEATLDLAKDSDEELIRLRGEMQAITDRSHAFAEGLKPRLEAVKQQIAKLGAPPAKDAPPEPEGVAAERAKLNALSGAMDGAIRTADLLAERASQVIDKVQQHQRDLFARSVLKRTPSPILPTLWLELGRESKRGLDDIQRLASNWWAIAEPQWAPLTGLVLGCLLLWLTLRMLAGRAIARYRDRVEGEPSFFARAAAATWVAPARALPPIIAMAALYAGLDGLDLLHLGMRRLMTTALNSVIAFASVTALAGALLAPGLPQWRLFQFTDRSAARVRWLIGLIASVYALDLFLKELNNIIFAPLSVTIAQSFLAGVAFAGLLIAVLRTPFSLMQPPQAAAAEPTEAPERVPALPARASRLEPRWLKLPLWVAALGIIGAAVLGYVSLARFMSGQIVITGSILAALMLLNHAVRALAGDLVDETRPGGRWLKDRLGFEHGRRTQIAFLFSTFVKGGLVLLALPLVLLQWGFDWQVVKGWLMAGLFGFKVGSVEVSLARILMAIALLTAGYFATRMLQRSLDKSVLTPPRMDAGIANSIRTAIGYAGIGASALVAVSYAGLDFTNLAIVAGALSVGIGFGLQSVVNNFVSGLILLVERPVKVGDWIVVGSDEGHVKRISVRSTEIETFDRSSVIIPNAELIQGRVKNWTLRDAVGRVRIPVGIAYDADPEKARQLLLQIANAHPGVLKLPQPGVAFLSFSPSSVDLALSLFVADVNQGSTVKTELAFEILKVFREAGIEMPLPQQDLHLRDLDPVRGMLSHALEEKRRQAAAEAQQPGRSEAPLRDMPLKEPVLKTA